MEVTTLQIALFFSNTITRPDELFSTLNNEMDNIFDAIPTSLPLPPEVLDVPLKMMTSSNNKYQCNIARSRIDLFINDNPTISNDMNQLVRLFIDKITTKTEVNRFGFVGSYFIEDENASKRIQDKYFKHTDEDIDEINVRFKRPKVLNNQTTNDNTMINSMVQVNQFTGATRKGLLIQKDINNNLQQATSPYKAKELKTLYDNCIELMSIEVVRELV